MSIDKNTTIIDTYIRTIYIFILIGTKNEQDKILLILNQEAKYLIDLQYYCPIKHL